MALTTPTARVILDDQVEHTVRILNVDMVAFDRERTRHKDWPAADEGAIFWITYLAWHALVRMNLIPKWPFGEFETRALQVELIPDEEQEVDPTPPGAEPG